MSDEARKYLISLVVVGEMDSLNRIIKNIYEDFSLTFYKTLLKTIIDKENIELELFSKEDCNYNKTSNKYVGFFKVSSTILTRNPNKIRAKLVDDSYEINSFLKRWNRANGVKLLLATKELGFDDDEYSGI